MFLIGEVQSGRGHAVRSKESGKGRRFVGLESCDDSGRFSGIANVDDFPGFGKAINTAINFPERVGLFGEDEVDRLGFHILGVHIAVNIVVNIDTHFLPTPSVGFGISGDERPVFGSGLRCSRIGDGDGENHTDQKENRNEFIQVVAHHRNTILSSL